MKVTLNNKIVQWPSEWPAPVNGMVVYDAGQSLEIFRVTWILPNIEKHPTTDQFYLNEPVVLVEAQHTFYQLTEDQMQDKLKT